MLGPQVAVEVQLLPAESTSAQQSEEVALQKLGRKAVAPPPLGRHTAVGLAEGLLPAAHLRRDSISPAGLVVGHQKDSSWLLASQLAAGPDSRRGSRHEAACMQSWSRFALYESANGSCEPRRPLYVSVL